MTMALWGILIVLLVKLLVALALPALGIALALNKLTGLSPGLSFGIGSVVMVLFLKTAHMLSQRKKRALMEKPGTPP